MLQLLRCHGIGGIHSVRACGTAAPARPTTRHDGHQKDHLAPQGIRNRDTSFPPDRRCATGIPSAEGPRPTASRCIVPSTRHRVATPGGETPGSATPNRARHAAGHPVRERSGHSAVRQATNRRRAGTIADAHAGDLRHAAPQRASQATDRSDASSGQFAAAGPEPRGVADPPAGTRSCMPLRALGPFSRGHPSLRASCGRRPAPTAASQRRRSRIPAAGHAAGPSGTFNLPDRATAKPPLLCRIDISDRR